MFRQSIRSSKSLALSFALVVVAAAGVTGCGGSGAEGDDPIVTGSVRNELVNADRISKLQPGEMLRLDLAAADTVYRFDYAKTSIDYGRVELMLDNRDTVPLEAQIASIESGEYGSFPKPDLHAQNPGSFKLAADPVDFGILTQSEIDEVETNGYFYSEAPAAAPSGSPQTTDDCVYAQCVICYDPVTGGPFDWTKPGTPVCVTIEHVWCD